MSETQTQELATPEAVSEDDAALLAEQEAFLNEGEPEAEAAIEPEPEPEAQPAAADDKAANLQKALAQSRYEQRQTQRQMKEMQQALAQLREPAQQRDDDPVIDPDHDPISAIKYLTHKVNAYEHQARQQQEEQQRREQQQQAETTLSQYMSENEDLARTEFPDYDAAVKYQVESRASELQALGYQPNDISQYIKQEYMGLINQAYQTGQNPAFLVYRQARARGFTGPAPVEETPAPAQQQIDAMRAGQNTPKTTRGGGGKKSSGTVTEDMLMNAKGAEFDRLWSQFEKQNAS